MRSGSNQSGTDSFHSKRRRFLQVLGAGGLAGAAGCFGGDGNGDDEENGGDGDGAFFEVSDLDPAETEADPGEAFGATATVANTGEGDGQQTVEYRIDGDTLGETDVDLEAGAETDVSFEDLSLEDYADGEYTHGVFSDDDDDTATLTVSVLGPPMPPREDYEDLVGMHPADAMETFSVAEGFEIELVACEPMINAPVDVKFDAKGRMWVVEMPDYLGVRPGDDKEGFEPGRVGHGSDHMLFHEYEEDENGDPILPDGLAPWNDSTDDDPPNGAVKVLEDTDGDGIYDEATTFLDELTLSRSLSLVEADDALVVAHAGRNIDESDLILARDNDDDLEADQQAELKWNWVSQDNTEHASNSLEYMLDNWLHNSNATEQFQVRNGVLEERSPGYSYGQWGLTEDSYGRTFHTTNPHLLWGDIVPGRGRYLYRTNGGGDSGLGVDLADGNDVHPIRPCVTNRSYIPPGETLDGFESVRGPDGRLELTAATSGPGAYWGGLFPEEFENDVFVPVPQGYLVAHMHLEDLPDTLDVDVSHETYGHNVEENRWAEGDIPEDFRYHREDDEIEIDQAEFVASTDEIFKPVNVRTGPDGALYIVDMYNGLFQHYLYMTWHSASQYVARELWKIDELEHGSGRIWRVVPEDADLDDPPELDELSPSELAEQLETDNGWVRRTAQRLIVQGQQTDAADTLREVARDGDHSLGRMHALWALNGLGEIDYDSVSAVLADEDDSHVLANAMQAGEPLLETDAAEDYVDELVALADSDHERVVVQAAYSLGEVADSDLQDEKARPALESVLDEWWGSDRVEDAVYSSPEMDFD